MGAQARLLILMAMVGGCTCDPSAALDARFACSNDADCVAGDVCTQGECKPMGASTGGGAGGGLATGGGAGGGSSGGGAGGTGGGGSSHLPASALTLTVSSPAAAGHCVPVQFGLLDSTGTSTLADAPVQVSLSVTPSQLSVFSDPSCTASAQQVSFVPGNSTAELYVQTPTGIDYQLSASAMGLTGAGATLSVTPVVRTLSCSFGVNDLAVDCPVVPPVRALSDSFVVLQVLPLNNTAGELEARCELAQVDDVKCSRGVSGDPLEVRLQVAELDQVLVQRVTTQCDGGALQPLQTSVDPAATLFFSSQSNGGSILDSNDFAPSDLDGGGDSVTYDLSGGCPGNAPMIQSTQVVTFSASAGVHVGHNTYTLAAGTDVITRTAIADAGLLMWRPRVRTGNVGVCDRAVRGEIDSANGQLHFARGNGAPVDGGCYDVNVNLHADQADLGSVAQVQQMSVSPNAGEPLRLVALPNAVDSTRTLVFSGGEGALGQAFGETDYDTDVGTDAYPGEMAACFTLDAGTLFSSQVVLERGASDGGASFTFFAVELNP